MLRSVTALTLLATVSACGTAKESRPADDSAAAADTTPPVVLTVDMRDETGASLGALTISDDAGGWRCGNAPQAAAGEQAFTSTSRLAASRPSSQRARTGPTDRSMDSRIRRSAPR